VTGSDLTDVYCREAAATETVPLGHTVPGAEEETAKSTTADREVTGQKPTIAEKLVRLGSVAKLFHAPDETAYATVRIGGDDGHLETWPLNNTGFRRWLQREYWQSCGKVSNAQALQDAIGVLSAMAVHDGPEKAVFTRVGKADSAVYIDLGGADWAAVEITAAGWRVVSEPPVKFRRARGMKPLPIPERGGSIDELRRFVNIRDEADFILFVGWLVGALNPQGPYPVLLLNGEQGSAKSTAERVARRLIDPYRPEFRSPPRSEHDLVIAAKSNWVLAYDNLSGIKPWLSDAFCRLATGSGFGTRKLYENDEETTFEGTRPQVMNGIGDVATRGDLLSRALVLVLPPITAGDRMTEADFFDAFDKACPRILGVLYDAVSAALRNLPTTETEALPRLADFARWVTAAEPAFGWPEKTFLDAVQHNQRQANELVLEASPITPYIRDLAADDWLGTPSELLVALNELAPESLRRSRAWPKSGKGLKNDLDRLAPNLRAIGINVERGRNGHSRFWAIRMLEEK